MILRAPINRSLIAIASARALRPSIADALDVVRRPNASDPRVITCSRSSPCVGRLRSRVLDETLHVVSHLYVEHVHRIAT
jgi:hypothetical protein